MSETLLRTKLFVPPLRPNLVPRSQLVELLNLGVQQGHKLTLISAPAGFGKTTLLSEWVSQSDDPVAWLSLEEDDNDRVRFLLYFTAAIQTLEPDIGDGVLAALQTPRPPSTEALLTTLINQISATAGDAIEEEEPTSIDHSDRIIILVLDDYHLVAAQDIHAAVIFLLDHLPSNLHLIMATRSDPPLPLARLRGRGLLTELRENDLRFSQEEATQFMNTAMDLEVSTDDLSVLNARTEGWIAGLQMAAISMRSRRRVDERASSTTDFIAAFSGSNRYILDYLVEEVLHCQPESIQTFLLHTAVLDRLTAQLCEALLGGVDIGMEGYEGQSIASAQDMLEYLERANLFITPLDEEQRWYRYHYLFADLLRNQLKKHHPDLRLELHIRASQVVPQKMMDK
jgi:LuxR family maltose regulon positive regulatory protein